MFRKKSVLPARPSLPKLEEIIEDLSVIQSDDVVFTRAASISSNSKNSQTTDSNNHGTLDHYDDLSDPNRAYAKVKAFSQKLVDLKNLLRDLEGQNLKLSVLEGCLIEDIKQIREEMSRSVYKY